MCICVTSRIIAEGPRGHERPRGTHARNVELDKGFGNAGNRWAQMMHQQQRHQYVIGIWLDPTEYGGSESP